MNQGQTDLISVIIPVYKVEQYLDKCVQSVVDQTYRNLEIILVDDGSPDRCGEMCDAWAQKDSRIRVIHKTNGGLSDARNAGLDIATGAYIGFVDSDDYIHPEMYQTLIHNSIENNADISICGYALLNESYAPLEEKIVLADEIIDNKSALWRLNDYAMPFTVVWNKLFRSVLFDSTRFTCGKSWEDAFIIHELIFKCTRISVISDILYYYIKRSNSISRTLSIRQLNAVEARYQRLSFYERNNLSVFLPATAAVILDSFLLRRKMLSFRSIQDLRYYFIIKNHVRYCYLKYGNLIRKMDIFNFEMPVLFHLLRRIKHTLISVKHKYER